MEFNAEEIENGYLVYVSRERTTYRFFVKTFDDAIKENVKFNKDPLAYKTPKI